jgi:hypothetical protein
LVSVFSLIDCSLLIKKTVIKDNVRKFRLIELSGLCLFPRSMWAIPMGLGASLGFLFVSRDGWSEAETDHSRVQGKR